MTNLFFDAVMVGLLIAAIIFCYRLNTRLKTMRQMGAELSPFMKNMTNYLGQISQSIDKLKQVADLGNQGLNEHIPVAINLKDDFDLLLEYSEKMARRLDEVIEKAREMDQRLQQTVRIADGARANDRRIEPTLQRSADSSLHQAPYTKDSYKEDRSNTTQRPFPIPPMGFEREDVDYFVPSHSRKDDSKQLGAKKEREPNQKNPTERGIMAKLRGLR